MSKTPTAIVGERSAVNVKAAGLSLLGYLLGVDVEAIERQWERHFMPRLVSSGGASVLLHPADFLAEFSAAFPDKDWPDVFCTHRMAWDPFTAANGCFALPARSIVLPASRPPMRRPICTVGGADVFFNFVLPAMFNALGDAVSGAAGVAWLGRSIEYVVCGPILAVDRADACPSVSAGVRYFFREAKPEPVPEQDDATVRAESYRIVRVTNNPKRYPERAAASAANPHLAKLCVADDCEDFAVSIYDPSVYRRLSDFDFDDVNTFTVGRKS